MSLELRPVFPSENYQPVFEQSVLGFTAHWWERVARPTGLDTDRFSVVKHGQEVARVEVDPDSRIALEDYAGLQIQLPVVDIEFFEVRADQRRRGLGREIVAALIDHYRGRDLIAFSEDADVFWADVGWKHVPRIDESRLYRPLFVHRANEPSAENNVG